LSINRWRGFIRGFTRGPQIRPGSNKLKAGSSLYLTALHIAIHALNWIHGLSNTNKKNLFLWIKPNHLVRQLTELHLLIIEYRHYNTSPERSYHILFKCHVPASWSPILPQLDLWFFCKDNQWAVIERAKTCTNVGQHGSTYLSVNSSCLWKAPHR
jgi:hypothetical protein